ncbi:MAG TPA: cytochrome c oxidase subunit II [Sphingomonadaceae bacterium]|nr:cytochrome c oxidase subunit II [Sphingomonadaceae bacterium]
MMGQPLGYLDAAGARAWGVLPLTWFTLIVSILVCLIVGILLWLGVRRALANGGPAETRATPVERGGNGVRWIVIGLILTAVPLFATLVWTMVALAAVSGPPDHPALVLDVTAHQWWWEVKYNGSNPSRGFTTANEIHVPIGVPILVRLHGGDVIHSFWVPKLTGKTDAIPGQTNQSWIEADKPGRYRGQCTEFCGAQHSKMGFEVVAEPMADFEKWRARQLQTAPPPATPAQVRGLALVEYRCGLCHTVRGTSAGAVTGPDLTHLMSRRTIAAGMLPNNPGTLSGWIQDPQGVKPGALMPAQYLSGQQLSDVRAYLETLK